MKEAFWAGVGAGLGAGIAGLIISHYFVGMLGHFGLRDIFIAQASIAFLAAFGGVLFAKWFGRG